MSTNDGATAIFTYLHALSCYIVCRFFFFPGVYHATVTCRRRWHRGVAGHRRSHPAPASQGPDGEARALRVLSQGARGQRHLRRGVGNLRGRPLLGGRGGEGLLLLYCHGSDVRGGVTMAPLVSEPRLIPQ